MLVLRPRKLARDPELEGEFLELVKAAFAYRRKTLANSFRRSSRFANTAALILSEAGISGERRAQDLTLGEYEQLAHVWRQHRLRHESPD